MQLGDKIKSREFKEAMLLILTIVIMIILSPALFILGATVEALHKTHRRDNGKRKRFFRNTNIINANGHVMAKSKGK